MDETTEETQGKVHVGTWMEPELLAMLDTLRADLNRSQYIRRLVRQDWMRQQGMVITHPGDQRRPAGGPR